MEIKELVNKNKDGQDEKAARRTDVGDIVEVRYNESKERIEFYSDWSLLGSRFLGSTPSKQKTEGYALVKKRERFPKNSFEYIYHFTFTFYPDQSKEDIAKENNKNEETRKKDKQFWGEKEIRDTKCWKCKETLSSRYHYECSSCNWLKCTCGACKMGCSGERLSNITENKNIDKVESLSNITDSKYKVENISNKTDSKYQKCSVESCIAKIPTSKVIEWKGRCPRHNQN